MTSTTKVVLGLVGAMAAGVVIGLLIAPEKGTEMRQRIKKTAGDWADQLGHLFHKVEEEGEELRQRARSTARAATTE